MLSRCSPPAAAPPPRNTIHVRRAKVAKYGAQIESLEYRGGSMKLPECISAIPRLPHPQLAPNEGMARPTNPAPACMLKYRGSGRWWVGRVWTRHTWVNVKDSLGNVWGLSDRDHSNQFAVVPECDIRMGSRQNRSRGDHRKSVPEHPTKTRQQEL